jgi:hypothetical protein
MRKRRKTPLSTPVQTNPAHLSIGDALFPEEWLNQKARESGFIKRKSRKIHPRNLLASLVEESLRGSPSYNDLASSIESNDGADPSRQAVAMRLGKEFEEFLKSILGHVISLKVDQDILEGKFDVVNFRSYRRVLVQDSTIIKLPAALFPLFSGVSNGSSTVCNARIQAVYELISGKLIEFSIDPYSKNVSVLDPSPDGGPRGAVRARRAVRRLPLIPISPGARRRCGLASARRLAPGTRRAAGA